MRRKEMPDRSILIDGMTQINENSYVLEEPNCKNCSKIFIDTKEGDSERCLAKKIVKKETDRSGREYLRTRYGKPNVMGKPCKGYSPQIGYKIKGY